MIRKYLALMRRSLGVMLEYRISMLIWMLSMSFPLVMLAVWLSLAQNGPVGGYTAADFISYYLLTLYIREMTTVWVSWELDSDIRHGELAIKLLHPLNPIHDYLSANLTDKVLRFSVLTPIVVAVALVVPGVHYAFTPLNVALFLATLVAAWFLRYMQQFVVGLLAFWFSEATTLQDIFWMLFLLLGGVVAPLDLLPRWLATIADYLPFRFMLSFPIEIAQGRLSTTDLLIGLGLCAGWLVFFQVLYRIVWRRGLRAFSAYGA